MAETRYAPRHVADVLIAAGVREEIWHLPDELSEVHNGDVINIDDLIEFHEALAGAGPEVINAELGLS